MHTRGVAVRWATVGVVSALLSTLLVLAAGQPRSLERVDPAAATTYLCSGYKPCKQAGYPHHGYAGANDQMYWRMYSGHNCTNYVAYRMIKAGMPNTRPWSGGGNASEWGKEMASITDQVPNVGAVAWWGRYSNGSGSAGHVAYVERVVSSTEIVVSEDSWGGTFHWRTITKSSGRWPTGFIHFVDKLIGPAGLPVVTGTPKVGMPLTASTGTWTGDPTAFSYQWYASAVPISGARSATYTPTADQLGKTLAVRVTATKSGATSAFQDSRATGAVTDGDFALVAAPVVTGAVLVDETLVATAGTWSPSPGETVWRWYADGVRLTDDTDPTLTLVPSLVDKTIALKVVAKRDGFVRTVTPTYTIGTVLAGVIDVPVAPTVSGDAVLGEILTVTPPTLTPSDATASYQWVRDGVPIAGANGLTYQVTDADVGHLIGVDVTATRPQFRPYQVSLPLATRVISPARLKLKAKAKGRKVVARVKVRAAGVDPVTGKVLIRIGKWSDTVRLDDGVARVTARMPRGKTKVRVRYLGSSVVPAAKATDQVRVR